MIMFLFKKIEYIIYCQVLYIKFMIPMEQFKTFFHYIISKSNKHVKLLFAEKEIYKLFKESLTNISYSPEKVNIINIDNIVDNIRLQLLKTKNYIIKVICSDGEFYVFKESLVKIKYFKNMLDGYNFGDDLIIDVKVISEIDDYDTMEIILKYNYTKLYDDEYINYETFNNYICIINFIGNIVDNHGNLMQYIVDNVCNEFHGDNITLASIENIFIILKQNKIDDICKIIKYSLKSMEVINNEDLIKTTFFNYLVDNDDFGKKFVTDNKIISQYDKIVNDWNVEHILLQLLQINTKQSWDIIIDIHKNKSKIINIKLCTHINEVSERIFDYDIKIFSLDVRLKIIKKSKRYEYVNDLCEDYFNNGSMISNTEFYKFIGDINEKSIMQLNISPINAYNPTKISDIFSQIINYYPLDYTTWKKCGYITGFYNENESIKGVKVNFWSHFDYKLNTKTKILIGYKLNEPYNIGYIEKILVAYPKNGEICYMDTDEINKLSLSICHTYYLVLIDAALFNIDKDYNIYITL